MSNKIVRRRNRQRVFEHYGNVCQFCSGSDNLEIQIRPGVQINYIFNEKLECAWATILSYLPNHILACRKHRYYYGAEDVSRHGTASKYNNHGCRCPQCKSAWSVYLKTRRGAMRQAPRLAAEVVG